MRESGRAPTVRGYRFTASVLDREVQERVGGMATASVGVGEDGALRQPVAAARVLIDVGVAQIDLFDSRLGQGLQFAALGHAVSVVPEDEQLVEVIVVRVDYAVLVRVELAQFLEPVCRAILIAKQLATAIDRAVPVAVDGEKCVATLDERRRRDLPVAANVEARAILVVRNLEAVVIQVKYNRVGLLDLRDFRGLETEFELEPETCGLNLRRPV